MDANDPLTQPWYPLATIEFHFSKFRHAAEYRPISVPGNFAVETDCRARINWIPFAQCPTNPLLSITPATLAANTTRESAGFQRCASTGFHAFGPGSFNRTSSHRTWCLNSALDRAGISPVSSALEKLAATSPNFWRTTFAIAESSSFQTPSPYPRRALTS